MKEKYNKEEWLRSAKEKQEELTNQLVEMAEGYVSDPERIADFLAFSARFHRYSARNCILIHQQNPYATFCASYHDWKQKDAHIKKGEKGIKILVPKPRIFLKIAGEYAALSEATDEQKMAYKKGQIEGVKKTYFGVGNVFDIGQTDFPAEEYPKLFDKGYSSEKHNAMFNGLSEYSKNVLNCPVEIKSLSSIALRGRYFPQGNTIEINEILDDTEKFSVLSHELGHAILHSISDIKNKSTAQIEFEADALSIMLQQHFGLKISESRIEHLAEHFQVFRAQIEAEDIKPDFIQIISPVFNSFHENIEEITNSIEKQWDIEKDKPDIQFKRDQIQQMKNGPEVEIKPVNKVIVQNITEEIER